MAQIYELKFCDEPWRALHIPKGWDHPIEELIAPDAVPDLRGEWEKCSLRVRNTPDITYFTPRFIACSSRVRNQIEALVEGCGRWLKINGIDDYWAFQITRVVPFVDEARSDIDYLSPGRPQYIYERVHNGVYVDGCHIFTPYASVFQWFVTEELKALIEAHRFTGVYFEPVPDH
ncbi:MAG: hypothetical protein QM645_05170 [Asticcacaulis sp.]